MPSYAKLVHDFAAVCLVCRHRFGNRVELAHPTNAKMHKLICRSCIENKALRRLYKDPDYKAALIAMWKREKEKKGQKQVNVVALSSSLTSTPQNAIAGA